MSYKVLVTSKFEKEAKKLSKKYKSFKTDYSKLISELEKNPLQGSGLGQSCYKVRMSIESKGKGKSGGARVISLVRIINEELHLLTIYDKSEKETISDKEIKKLLESVLK